jgi:hypothetical protein
MRMYPSVCANICTDMPTTAAIKHHVSEHVEGVAHMCVPVCREKAMPDVLGSLDKVCPAAFTER